MPKNDIFQRVVKQDELSCVGSGMHGEVWSIRSTSYVVKISKSPKVFHDSEKQIYERLGQHQHILHYHGEAQIEFSSEHKKGLVFDYHKKDRLMYNLSLGSTPAPAQSTKRLWVLQISQAIAHIQSNGVVHAHLGFQNILLGDDGSIKIADFGGSCIDGSRCYAFPSAKCRRSSAIAPAVRPDRAPESIYWQPTPDVREDTFALGMMVFELWTGSLLYDGMSDAEILDLHDRKKWPSLETVEEEIIRKVLIGCWEGILSAADVAVLLEDELKKSQEQ